MSVPPPAGQGIMTEISLFKKSPAKVKPEKPLSKRNRPAKNFDGLHGTPPKIMLFVLVLANLTRHSPE